MSEFKEYSRLDGLAIADLIRRGEVTASEVLDAALARLDTVNPTVNAVVQDLREGARLQVDGGALTGPFAGVPFLIKDFAINLAGTPTTFGSRLMKNALAETDSAMMGRYKEAGLVTLGKTATSEFGFNAATEALAYGAPTRNPWDLRRSASGSSGGSAVAVATGVVPVAHADDGGGSIRLPASHNGVFGLKPTRGRVPFGPTLPDSAFAGLAAPHVITRTVRDSAAMLDATAGPDIGATYFAPPPAHTFLSALERPTAKLRIAYCEALTFDTPVHPDCQAALADAVQLCESLGHDLVPLDANLNLDEFSRQWCTAIVAWLATFIDGAAAGLGMVPSLDNLESVTLSALQYGRAQPSRDLVLATLAFNDISRQIGGWFEDHDILLTPTVSKPPPLLGVMDQNASGADAYEFVREHLFALGHTCGFFNVSGNPAMSVPLFWTADGLPIGTQFVARYADERTLFGLAGQLERARCWHDRRPPVVEDNCCG
ncbi:MAG: amidase [Pseudomonadota bacterium]